MKEQILKLREEGKSYNEICNLLGCSKGTVAYHCGKGQKEKTLTRLRKRRKEKVILTKISSFLSKKSKPPKVNYSRTNEGLLRDKAEDFQRRSNDVRPGGIGKRQIIFRWKDVIAKFGWETNCYLTGRPINLKEPKTYQFDHIIPASKSGDNTLDNLGIVCRAANAAKSDLSIEELLILCEEILVHNGYKVEKHGKEPNVG